MTDHAVIQAACVGVDKVQKGGWALALSAPLCLRHCIANLHEDYLEQVLEPFYMRDTQ